MVHHATDMSSSALHVYGVRLFACIDLHLTFLFFFFNDTATTEIYTLSLHDALPICSYSSCSKACRVWPPTCAQNATDRKSTRLNSSHITISYAVFCLKKKTEHEPADARPERDRSEEHTPELHSHHVIVVRLYLPDNK